MLERLTDAYLEAAGLAPEEMTPDYRGKVSERLRAVLVAMREPSEGMIAVGGAYGEESWRYMIDAAIDEPAIKSSDADL